MEEQEISKKQKKKLGKGATLLMVLLAILAALLATYALIKAYNARLDQAAKESIETTEMLKFEVEDVESFSYLSGDDLVTFERDGDDWVFTDDKKLDVDEDRVDDMLKSISSVKTQQVVAEIVDPDKLGSYGLKNPSFLVSLKFEDGTGKTLYLGAENPMTQSTYARVDQEAVFMAESGLADMFVPPEQLKKQEGTASSGTEEDTEQNGKTGAEDDDRNE